MKAVVINLARREDRLKAFKARWKDAGMQDEDGSIFPVEVFEAVDGASRTPQGTWAKYPPSVMGCTLSHVTVVRQAMNAEVRSLLVMEDDVVFCEGFHDRFISLTAQLPPNWELVLLGAQPRVPTFQPRQIKPGIVISPPWWRSHAYMVRGRSLRRFYEHISVQTGHFDDIMNRTPLRSYMLVPQLCGQDNSVSDIGATRDQPTFWNAT